MIPGGWLWLALGLARAEPGNGEADMSDRSWVPEGWTAVLVPGIELPTMTAWILEEDGPRARGALRSAGHTFEGMAAYRLALAAMGPPDPVQRSRVACLLIDPGGAGQVPWTGAADDIDPDYAAFVGPPRMEGETLIYWRAHGQLDDMVRVRVDAGGTVLGTELASEVAASLAAPQDPILRATEELQAWDYSGRVSALKRLASSGDPRAVDFILEAARSQEDWRVREAAVGQLGMLAASGKSTQLVAILESDPHEKVRRAAARALGQLLVPSTRDGLTRAKAHDASPLVRAAAEEALTRMR